jgi:hypothetical protein
MVQAPSRALMAVILGLTWCTLILPRDADAQTGTRTTPDGARTLISKDVGAERWAITVDPKDGSVTGNVFLSDGSAPKFVWCERTGDDDRLDPENVQIELRCYGQERCDAAPCVPDAWQLIGDVTLPGSFFLPAQDPFSPLQRPGVFCDPLAHRSELIVGVPSFTVETAGCNYLTIVQPTLAAIQVGDPIYVRIWHFMLTAPAPAVAYLALRVGDDPLWSAEIPIPSNTGLVIETTTATHAAPAGTPIYFHVQNHGENSYNLIDVKVGGEFGTQLVSPDLWSVASTGVPDLPR